MSSKSSKLSGTGKNKPEKLAVSEISSARSKLDGVLQTLVTRTEDSDLIELENIKVEPDLLATDFASSAANVKKGSPTKPPRKRRRKDDAGNSEMNSFHHTYVMKLFDRSVDLAQFSENIPLYPVCRAWMFNQPQKVNANRQLQQPTDIELLGVAPLEDNKGEENRFKDVRQLPPPLPMPPHSNSQYEDMRIPSPIPQTEEPLKLFNENQIPPSREYLMGKHLVRWKKIRQKWKDAAGSNEQRYKESLSIIKAIFER